MEEEWGFCELWIWDQQAHLLCGTLRLSGQGILAQWTEEGSQTCELGIRMNDLFDLAITCTTPQIIPLQLLISKQSGYLYAGKTKTLTKHVW